MRKTLAFAGILLVNLIIWPWVLRAWVHWSARERIYENIQAIPIADVALVLGAGLWADGTPTPALYDRVATAVDLYKAGKVKKLLMSGDNRFVWYNEPEAMRQLALRLGAPDEDIVLDYAGRRTYDSCYRAREIFEVKEAIVVTQRFHLDRALYLCDALGIQSVGVVADRRTYTPPYAQFWWLRETPAVVSAWLDINILHPLPVLGEQLPIEITSRQREIPRD
jgi:SanA protein